MAVNNLVILGSTGSVGCNTLDVVSGNPDFRVYALSAHRNVQLLAEQCARHNPRYAILSDPAGREELTARLAQADCTTELLVGSDKLEQVVAETDVHSVMAAIVGAAGLASSLAAINAGKRLLLANKEALVMSGQLFMEAARVSGAQIIPIDSEHNAVYQCLPHSSGGSRAIDQSVSKICLTASGGPFLNYSPQQLTSVTPEQACKHPRWDMGRKISVDSATMMNKGLELIEACFLFALPPQRVEVLIHPQSIVHSLVYYADGSVLAQLANPDMRIPIAYGLAYPERIESGAKTLDLAEISNLDFLLPDSLRFPCLDLGRAAAEQGGTAPVILNAANEEAVTAFLDGNLPFVDIPLIIEQALSKIPCEAPSSLAIIQEVDERTRRLAKELIFKE